MDITFLKVKTTAAAAAVTTFLGFTYSSIIVLSDNSYIRTCSTFSRFSIDRCHFHWNFYIKCNCKSAVQGQL